jgi:lysophospholipase L1-like esterase
MTYQVICVLGSSTANGYWDEEGLGWVGRLSMKVAKTYPYKFGFNNLAQSGDTSLDMLHRLSAEALSREPDILIISGGANDLNRWNKPDAQTDLSEALSKQNWYKMLTLAKNNIDKILIIALPPIKENDGSSGDTLYRFNKDNDVYNQNLQIWCKEFNVPFLDISKIWSQENFKEYVHDNVHPTAKGHQHIADQVFDELKRIGILK